MKQFARKLWTRMPVDGSGWLPFGSRRQRLFQKLAARGFWRRNPRGIRMIGRMLTRLLWIPACPIRTAAILRRNKTASADFWSTVWAGWTTGRAPEDTILFSAMARGDQARLRVAQDIPGDRQGVLLMGALGSADDMRLAADKLETSRLLTQLGLRVPVTCDLITRGRIPDTTAVHWNTAGKLVIKPRRGMASQGLSAIVTSGEGRFVVDGSEPIDSRQLAALLLRRATNDDLLVQHHVAPGPETRDLSPDAPVAVRVFAMRPAPGACASVLSAFLKIIPAGTYVPHGIFDLLVVPIDPQTGELSNGILFDKPSQRWPEIPWSGVTIRGRTLRQWSEIVGIIERASEIMPRTPLIGWDLLLGPDGPVILEANTGVSLFRAALWHFERGEPSPLFPALEQWCGRAARDQSRDCL